MASTTSDTGDTSSEQQNACKKNTRARGPFHQSITAILTEEKKKRSRLLNLHMLQSTCLGTKIETGVDSNMTVRPRASTERKKEE